MSSTWKAGIFALVVIFITRYNLRSYENIKSNDWMSYMNESCAATKTGSIKSMLYNDLDLWSHVNISMDSWNESIAIEQPQRDCEFLRDEKRKGECLAHYQSEMDWYNRCYSVALKNAYDAKGRGERLYIYN